MSLHIHSETENSGPKRIVAIAAGKGGVGKSTVTVSLARALQRAGHSVGILDTDIYGPSLRQMLPEDRLPKQDGPTLVPALCEGIRVISMAYFRQANEATAVRAPIANRLINQFLSQVQWGPLDYLLIDFPPGTGDVQLTLSQQAPLTAALMVTTPQVVAGLDVRKAIHLFEQVRVPIVGVVENMSYLLPNGSGETIYPFGRGGGKRLSSEVGVPFLGQIPLDPELCRCCDEGCSPWSDAPGPATEAFDALAQEFHQHIETLVGQGASCLQSFEIQWKEMSPS